MLANSSGLNMKKYNPHSIRNYLVSGLMELNLNPEQLKAVIQNFSHNSLTTTVNNNYYVCKDKQNAIINNI